MVDTVQWEDINSNFLYRGGIRVSGGDWMALHLRVSPFLNIIHTSVQRAATGKAAMA